MTSVANSVRQTRHFQEPMDAFYTIPSSVKSSVLTQCVHGMIIARSSAMPSNTNLLWSAGHSQNLVEVDGVNFYMEDGQIVDEKQKPVTIYKELVKALSTPGQCVLDVCCGTGTGMVAGLSEGRSVISVDIDGEMETHIRLRMSKEVPSRPVEPNDSRETDEEADDEMLIERDEEDGEAAEEDEEGMEECEDSQE